MEKEISIITLTEGSEGRKAYFKELRKSLERQHGVKVHWLISAPHREACRSLVGDDDFIDTIFIQYNDGDTLGKRRNTLLQNVQTEYVMNIDDDDYLHHDLALWNSIQELEENPSANTCIGRIITKMPNGVYRFWSDNPAYFVNGSYQLSPGLYSRNNLIERIFENNLIPVYSGAAVYRTDCSLEWSEKLNTYEDLYALLHSIGDNQFIMSSDIRYVYRKHSYNTMDIFTSEEKLDDLTHVLKSFF